MLSIPQGWQGPNREGTVCRHLHQPVAWVPPATRTSPLLFLLFLCVASKSKAGSETEAALWQNALLSRSPLLRPGAAATTQSLRETLHQLHQPTPELQQVVFGSVELAQASAGFHKTLIRQIQSAQSVNNLQSENPQPKDPQGAYGQATQVIHLVSEK